MCVCVCVCAWVFMLLGCGHRLHVRMCAPTIGAGCCFARAQVPKYSWIMMYDEKHKMNYYFNLATKVGGLVGWRARCVGF